MMAIAMSTAKYATRSPRIRSSSSQQADRLAFGASGRRVGCAVEKRHDVSESAVCRCEIEGGRHPRNARFKDRHVNKLTRNELMKAIEKINCRGCAGRREVAVDDGKRRLVLASLR